jgi:hypothetical protein
MMKKQGQPINIIQSVGKFFDILLVSKLLSLWAPIASFVLIAKIVPLVPA